MKVPYYRQNTKYTCGPAALRMVLSYFGIKKSEKALVQLANTTKKHGTSYKSVIAASRHAGLYCFAYSHADLHLIRFFIDQKLPVIVSYIEPSDEEGHYAVVVGYTSRSVILNDPWNGSKFTLSNQQFLRRWRRVHGNKPRRWICVLSQEKMNLGKQLGPR